MEFQDHTQSTRISSDHDKIIYEETGSAYNSMRSFTHKVSTIRGRIYTLQNQEITESQKLCPLGFLRTGGWGAGKLRSVSPQHNAKTTYTRIAALERSVVNINTGTWGGGGQLHRFYWYQIFNQGSYAVNMRF